MKGHCTCQEDEDVSRSIFSVDVRGCLDGRSDVVRAWLLQIVNLRSIIIIVIMHWQLERVLKPAMSAHRWACESSPLLCRLGKLCIYEE